MKNEKVAIARNLFFFFSKNMDEVFFAIFKARKESRKDGEILNNIITLAG